MTDSVHLYRVNGSRKVEQVCSLLTILDEQPLPVWQREPPKAARPCNPRTAETVEWRAATHSRVLDTLRAGVATVVGDSLPGHALLRAGLGSFCPPMKAIGFREKAKLTASLTTLIWASLLLQSPAAPATSGELKLRRQWVAQHFDTKAGALPFSFTYGGCAATELLPAWKLERPSAKRQPGRVERTLTCADPATGLRVRCDLTEYDGLPAVEWVLHFENRGTQDTPILERILPLDTAFKTEAQANVVVHHSVGEKNSGQSFAPVEEVLAPGSTRELVFAPIGGRSSDGQMPFFNLAWQGGGVATAIGWSGQWEARFQRSAPGTLAARAGQQLVHCTLHPGESIRTPRILLVFWGGAATRYSGITCCGRC